MTEEVSFRARIPHDLVPYRDRLCEGIVKLYWGLVHDPWPTKPVQSGPMKQVRVNIPASHMEQFDTILRTLKLSRTDVAWLALRCLHSPLGKAGDVDEEFMPTGREQPSLPDRREAL